MQNIGGENAGDAFYRYKMPKLIAKIEGRGNGIKTNVVNNVDIAKALERPPEYILKFYGCELGAQTNFDKSTGTSIVNGAHDQKKLSELLESFIKKYVQCYSCGNPETTVKIKKEFIFLKCKACGYVSDVDMRHKVNTFILKNPPENKLSKEEKRLKKAEEERMRDAHESAAKEKKEKKEKKDKKDKKDKKKKKEGEEGGAPEGDDVADGDDGGSPDPEDEESEEEVVWMTDTSAAAVAARAAEQLTAATAAMVTQGNIEAEKAEAKKKAKAEAKKKAEEEAKRKAAEAVVFRAALEAGEKLDPSAAEIALRAVLADAGWNWTAGIGGASAIAKVAASGAVKKLNVEGGVAVKARVLFAALFTAEAGSAEGVEDGSDSPTGPSSPKANGHATAANGNGSVSGSSPKLGPSITAAAPLLEQLAGDAPGQLALLVALEWLLAMGSPGKLREAPVALKALYDADLAEEDIILAWADRADAAKVLGVSPDEASAVRKGVDQVVQWLQEAESDEEEEEEEEDDEEDDE